MSEIERLLQELSEDWDVLIDRDAVSVTSRRNGHVHRYARSSYPTLGAAIAAAHAGEPPAGGHAR